MMTCCRLDPAPKLDAAAMSSVVTDVVAVCYTSVFDSVTNTTKSVYTGENTEYFGLERHLWAYIVGGVFAGLAIVISLFSVALHYRYNIDQRLKSSIILLHFMVPVYALCSWLGLVWNHYSMYFNAFRGIYEAICIYSFFNFLIAYLGGEEHVVHLISEKEQRYHAAPFSWCMEHWPMGHQYFYKSKVGCMQYVVIMFLLSIIQFICHMIPSGQSETSGHTTYYYMEGQWAWNNAYGYLTMVLNFSQLWAMYCLVFFYLACTDDLAPTQPVPKLATVKAVVFLTFWQSMLIAGLVKLNVLQPTCTYTIDQASDGLQNFLICIEMFFAAIAHWKYFHVREFMELEFTAHDKLDQLVGSMIQSESPSAVEVSALSIPWRQRMDVVKVAVTEKAPVAEMTEKAPASEQPAISASAEVATGETQVKQVIEIANSAPAAPVSSE